MVPTIVPGSQHDRVVKLRPEPVWWHTTGLRICLYKLGSRAHGQCGLVLGTAAQQMLTIELAVGLTSCLQ